MNYSFIVILIAAVLFIASCNSGPKVIPAASENSNTENGTGIFSEETPPAQVSQLAPSATQNVHAIVVEEVLPTEKYVYLRVKEGADEYWLATSKQEIKVGEAYFYREGLLKTNFVSKEYNRTFDKLFLVSNIVKADHGNMSGETSGSQSAPQEKIEVKNSVKIADLKANPKKYEGKTIQVSGKCMKVNANIMGRNWIHLNDGSTDYDLVVTSEDFVSDGQTVTMTGTVVLDKDFGAGYFYDILVEEGKVVQF